MKAKKWFTCLIAALLAITLACGETEPQGPPKSIDTLFSEYFSAPSWPENEPGDHVLWQAAGAWYRDGAIGGTSNALKAAVEDSTFTRPRDQVDFYQGVCQLLLSRDLVSHLQGKSPAEDAIRLFDSLPEESPYREEAQWLKALTYLRTGRIAESREALKAVTGPNKKKAKALKKELEKLPDNVELEKKP